MAKYHNIQNISLGLIDIFKLILGYYISGGPLFGGLTLKGHFVLVFEYSRL